MRSDRTLLVLASGSVLGVAVAGAVFATRRVRRRPLLEAHEWAIEEADVLLDLARLV